MKFSRILAMLVFLLGICTGLSACAGVIGSRVCVSEGRYFEIEMPSDSVELPTFRSVHQPAGMSNSSTLVRADLPVASTAVLPLFCRLNRVKEFMRRR